MPQRVLQTTFTETQVQLRFFSLLKINTIIHDWDLLKPCSQVNFQERFFQRRGVTSKRWHLFVEAPPIQTIRMEEKATLSEKATAGAFNNFN